MKHHLFRAGRGIAVADLPSVGAHIHFHLGSHFDHHIVEDITGCEFPNPFPPLLAASRFDFDLGFTPI